jgi:hypothetical protein
MKSRSMRWAAHLAHTGAMRGTKMIFFEILKKRPLAKPNSRQKDDIDTCRGYS